MIPTKNQTTQVPNRLLRRPTLRPSKHSFTSRPGLSPSQPAFPAIVISQHDPISALQGKNKVTFDIATAAQLSRPITRQRSASDSSSKQIGQSGHITLYETHSDLQIPTFYQEYNTAPCHDVLVNLSKSNCQTDTDLWM